MRKSYLYKELGEGYFRLGDFNKGFKLGKDFVLFVESGESLCGYNKVSRRGKGNIELKFCFKY